MAAPEYSSTFPTEKHPHAASFISKTQEYYLKNWPWKSDVEKEQYIREEIELSAIWCLPTVPDDRMETMTKWYTWGFLLDDILEVPSKRTAERAIKLLDIIVGKAMPEEDDKVQVITHDIYQSFVNVQDEESRRIGQVLQEANLEWIMRSVKAAKHADRPVTETTEEYIGRRVKDAGTKTLWISFRWALAGRFYVPQHVFGHQIIQQMELIYGKHMVIANDLYSYRKEVKDHQEKRGSIIFDNIVAVIMQEKGVTDVEAMGEVYRRLRSLEEEYYGLEEMADGEFNGPENEAVRKYIESLRYCASGVVSWSSTSARYNVDV